MFNQYPHSLEAEQYVIGAMLINPEVVPFVVERLQEDHFYTNENRLIFQAFKYLNESGKACDPLTVVDILKASGDLEKAGGMEYVMNIVNDTPSSANYNAYSNLIINKYKERKVLTAASAMANEIYSDEPDSDKKINNALAHVSGIEYTEAQEKTFDSVMRGVLNAIEARYNNKEAVGISSGLKALDARIGGLTRTDLIVLAARPAMGKTTLAMNIAQATLNQGEGCTLVFSMEMSAEQLMTRMLSSRGNIFLNHLVKGEMEQEDWTKLSAAVRFYKDHPIVIDDRPALTPQQVRARALRELRKHKNIKLIVIDYLQLMTVNSKSNRTEQVSEISRSLKALAKEIDCPVIALSQLNRSLEQRQNKRPIMADLRESGAIEQDADIIWFLYRDEVYNENSDRKGIAELITAKYRQGEIGTDYLAAKLWHSKFVDLEGEVPTQQQTPSGTSSPMDAWERRKLIK